MSNPIVGQQHHVVTYHLVDANGVVKETHATFDTEIPNVVIPEGMTLQVVEVPPELPMREVNHVVARAEEYPSVGDQLDVIWAMFRANPQLLTSEGRAMLARIQSVKSTYAKGCKFELNLGDDSGAALYVPKET